MSGINDAADDRDDAAAAGSAGGQRDMESLAREWARHDEHDRSDRLFEAVVRAAQDELLTSVRAMACQMVGPEDAEDAINSVWGKLWAKQGPRGGPDPAERDVGADGADDDQ
jgi:hypothetical protein